MWLGRAKLWGMFSDMDPIAAKYIGAGFASVGIGLAAVGVGVVFAMAPEKAKTIGLLLTVGLAASCLLVVLALLFFV
jgi:hypothetical protein